ncbi:MAG: hypothetical protein Q4F01_09435 [Staphylococcus rostri]|uniref:hypothetical protein n=1 Tax=Staphylococcus rostri TaxID=522262 RepID=UPI0026E0EF2E|nr:hypothetical protein [Staphylococcus rostri]MDO5376387.1 hypothetical protein [Staphylococcus rostri]
MEIYLYKKNGSRNDQIFAFQNLNKDLVDPLTIEVNNKKKSLSQLNFREYNPLVKDRECIDTIDIDELKDNSEFFKNLFSYFKDSSEYIDTIQDLEKNQKYSLMIYKIGDEIFVKQFDGNRILSRTSLVGEFHQQKLQKARKKLFIFDGNFDFYFDLSKNLVIIKNSSRFEKICNYEAYFDKVRADKIIEIKDSDIISNFDDIREEINNKKFNRLFTQLDDLNINKITSNTDLISRLEQKEIFFKDDKFEIKEPENSHILLFLLSGKVSINNYDQVVLTKDHELIIDRRARKTQNLARI